MNPVCRLIVALALLASEFKAQEVKVCRYNERSFASNPTLPIRGKTHTCFCNNGNWEGCTLNGPQQQRGHDVRPQSAMARRSNFDDLDFVFDLRKQPKASSGLGGEVRVAMVANFPALQGQGVAYILFNIEPCGINLPNLHPRATEIVFVVKGQLRTAIAEENGGRTVINDIREGQSTFFPQGLMHYEQNLGCEPAEFLTILNSEDPGVLTISKRIFSFPTEALESTLNLNPEQIEILKKGIPAGPAKGRIECLKKCGLYHDTSINVNSENSIY